MGDFCLHDNMLSMLEDPESHLHFFLNFSRQSLCLSYEHSMKPLLFCDFISLIFRDFGLPGLADVNWVPLAQLLIGSGEAEGFPPG